MKLSNFEMIEKDCSPGGYQCVLQFGDHHQLSIISGKGAYGGDQGLYEIAVFVNGNFATLPGIIDDEVKGWMSESDVDTVIKKLWTITAKEPEQV